MEQPPLSPIGVIPQWRHRELLTRARLVDLHEAILRYIDAGLPLNPLWASEYLDLAIDIDLHFRQRAQLQQKP